jgi:zinc protease
MLAQITIDPAQAQTIADTIVAIASDLQKNGATPDELARAKQPIITALKESARTNPYWLNAVIGSCQEFPQRLDWCRTRTSDFEGITKAEIDALAASAHLPGDRAAGNQGTATIIRPVVLSGSTGSPKSGRMGRPAPKRSRFPSMRFPP